MPAHLPAVIDAFAAAGFGERQAIDNICRSVRESGLIATGKRGRGANPVSDLDLAILLIAVAVPARSVSERIDATRAIMALRGSRGDPCVQALEAVIWGLRTGRADIRALSVGTHPLSLEITASTGLNTRFSAPSECEPFVVMTAYVSGAALKSLALTIH